MSRYVHDIKTNCNAAEAVDKAEAYLSKEGFDKVVHDGEQVWKKGKGLALGPQFVKVEVRDGCVHLEAWIKMAILPGVYVAEMDTEGFIGSAPKKKLKKRVLHIEQCLS